MIHQDSLGNYKDGTSKDDKEWQMSLEPHEQSLSSIMMF
jgi:hypothetical protein